MFWVAQSKGEHSDRLFGFTEDSLLKQVQSGEVSVEELRVLFGYRVKARLRRLLLKSCSSDTVLEDK